MKLARTTTSPARAAFALAGLALMILLAGVAAAGADTPRRPEELKLGPLEFNPVQVTRDTLACGVPVILYENHDLPILDLTIQFRMGIRYLPVTQQTAARILSSLWRDGGTEKLSADSLDFVLTALDASVSSGVGQRTSGVSISLSTEDAARALPLWRDVALEPRFEADRFERARANRLKEIQEINNDPAAIAAQRLGWLVWGQDHPAAHVDTRAEIEGVTPAGLRAIHARYVRPENAVIGVSGDFRRAEMLARLNELFREWPATGPYEPPVAAPWDPHPAPGVYLLRGDYAQSQVRIARMVPGLTESSPDLAACRLLSFALGYERVFYRTREEGLSYGTYVALSVGDEYSQLRGGGSGRSEATLPLLRAMLGEIADLPARPVTSEELEAARILQVGGEIQSSETAAAIVQRRVESLLRDRPEDFYEQLLRRLREATPEDLARVGTTYVTREDPWIVLVLGNPDTFGEPLESLGLGPVRELEPVVFGE